MDGGRVQVVVTIDERLGDDPGPWIVERMSRNHGIPRIIRLAQDTDSTILIAPETMGVLADLTRTLEVAGVRLLGSSDGAVSLTGDKPALAAHLLDRGIETPRCRVVRPRDGLPRDAVYPAVLKPVDGAGTIDTFLVEGPEDLPEAARELSRAILQPYVVGAPMSAIFLVDTKDRAWPLAIGTQDVALRGGRFEYRGGRLPAEGPTEPGPLRSAVESVRGLRGFVGVDYLWDDRTRRATVLEINPRPTTSIVGIVRLLAPGRLASAWVAALEPYPDVSMLAGLADEIRARASIRFDASGALLEEGAVR